MSPRSAIDRKHAKHHRAKDEGATSHEENVELRVASVAHGKGGYEGPHKVEKSSDQKSGTEDCLEPEDIRHLPSHRDERASGGNPDPNLAPQGGEDRPEATELRWAGHNVNCILAHLDDWDAALTTLCRFLAERDVVLHQDQLMAFSAFREGLYRANEVMNLTRVPKVGCELRHFVDSLLFVDLVPHGAAVLDIGTGPGFPAWPLACARPDLKVTALDSSGKMLGFLRGHPLPNLVCHEGRMEESGWVEMFDVVTGRAVAPLSTQLELSAAATKRGGCVIPMRSANDRESIEALQLEGLGLQLERVESRVLPGTDVERLFPLYRKVRATAKAFPRSWAEMKRAPLP